MKILFSIITIFLLSFQLMLKTTAVVWYKVNKKYIASELCENRDKPEMHCNGRCVLAKKIAAAERGESHMPYPSQIQTKIEPCVIYSKVETPVNSEEIVSNYLLENFAHQQPINQHLEGVFHPPRLA